MTAIAGPSPQAGGELPPATPAAPGESCPLCGAPLDREQEWCLRCGAAARTRLAAAPNWRAPAIALVIVGALSLGVMAAALVKLAGDSGSSPPASTRTVTTASTPPAAAPSTGASGAPATTSPIPPTGATVPGATGAGPAGTSPSGVPGAGTSTVPGATATIPSSPASTGTGTTTRRKNGGVNAGK